MKYGIKILLVMLLTLVCSHNRVMAEDDVREFDAVLYNKDMKISIVINAYDNNVTVPGQEIFGEISGYLKYEGDSRCWLFTAAEVNHKGNSVTLEIVNDYGSEDLTATLTANNKGVYTLKQGEGSTIKIAKGGKWVKLPKSLDFTIKKQPAK